MEQDHIDALLERYLHLLHEYTCLREELSVLQMGMYQNIARANFAAERGVRFGQDYYDERMQASRRIAISVDRDESESQDETQARGSLDNVNKDTNALSGATIPLFIVTNCAATTASASTSSKKAENLKNGVKEPDPDPHPKAGAKPVAEAESAERSATETTETEGEGEGASSTSTPSSEATKNPDAPPRKAQNVQAPAPQQKPTDPLRWFGLLTPLPLRQAQAQSIRAVEHVIPRLASVNAEMAEVEIEVRRARKRRAKAASVTRLAQQQHKQQQGGREQELGSGREGGVTA